MKRNPRNYLNTRSMYEIVEKNGVEMECSRRKNFAVNSASAGDSITRGYTQCCGNGGMAGEANTMTVIHTSQETNLEQCLHGVSMGCDRSKHLAFNRD